MKVPVKFLILLLASCGITSAATFSLNPVADAFVSAANATSNYGGAGAVGAAAAGLSKGEFDSLLKFDLSSAKASFDSTFGAGSWAINSATLRLTLTAPNTAIFNGNGAGAGGTNINFAGAVAVKWMQNDTWIEGTGTPATPTTNGITFSTLPSFLSGADEALGSFSFGGGTSGNVTSSLNLMPSFAADATAGNSLSLLLLPDDTGVALLANSTSVGPVANRPLLTLDASAIPEPCAAALIATGALGWLAQRRRRGRGRVES